MSREVTNEELERMDESELRAWSAAGEERWEPNELAGAARTPMVPITIRMPEDLLEELKAEAAKHGHRYQRYARALMLLGLRTVQAGRVDALPAEVKLSPRQLRELTEHGSVTLQLTAG